jgi:type II secretory pathway component PulF
MAAFEYLALDGNGRQQKGVLEADSARQVRQILRDRQLSPLDVQATRTREQARGGGHFSLARGLSARDLALLTRQLATLIQAALPIEEALRAAAAQARAPRIQGMLLAVRPFPSYTGLPWRPASMPATSVRCWNNWPITPSSASSRGRRSSWRCSIR